MTAWKGGQCDVPGQEFADAVDGVVGDAFEHVVEVELRVKLVELGCAEQGVDGGGAFSSGVRTGEEIVLRPNATTRRARSAVLSSISSSPSST